MGGHDKNQERQDALSALGRPLARRARARCELCEAAGVSLKPHELWPGRAEPQLEHTVLLCEGCAQDLSARRIDAPERWRPLESSMWSEVPAVKVLAVWMLDRLQAQGVAWATPLRDTAWLSEEEQAWFDALA